jgi:hypothetical protein
LKTKNFTETPIFSTIVQKIQPITKKKALVYKKNGATTLVAPFCIFRPGLSPFLL